MTLQLLSLAPFARGGNRLCFVHPDDPARCIKVQRPDFSLAERRRRKGFPKNLRRLASFDDNLQESGEMQSLDRLFGEPLYAHVSRCFGFEESDMGKGLVSELIRDENGTISHTLKQYIWDHGFDDNCRNAVQTFAEHWQQLAVPSRDLLLHNLVVQRAQNGVIQRLVIIDGIGNPSWIPIQLWPKALRIAKAQRKLANLHQRIQLLLRQRGKGTFPGYHGRLYHEGIEPSEQQRQ